ncbi:hypothetical protein ONZ45_g15128 [Pleurotus djamor]|nr:hypothetical protein ONZ45_g15128 [Pleurotus djamor]
MRGFFQSGNLNRPDIGVQFIGHALDIVKLGRKQWPNASSADRGDIFSDTFLFNLQSEWLEQYYRAYDIRCNDPDSPYSLEDMKKEADSLIHAIDSNPSILQDLTQRQVDTGFQLSFVTYPKVNAYAILGFYYGEKARGATDAHECIAHLDKAGANYMMAARSAPEDDVYHLNYLECALQLQIRMHSTLKVTYPVIQKISKIYPQVKKIWAYSALFMSRDARHKKVIEAERKISEMLGQGTLSMDDVYPL